MRYVLYHFGVYPSVFAPILESQATCSPPSDLPEPPVGKLVSDALTLIKASDKEPPGFL